MDNEIRAKLKALLSQPNRDDLLDDPRRLAELVRERLGLDRRREAGFLNAVLQEGVPKRLLAMPASSLSGTMLDNYARKVSDDIGLKEDIARSAIAAWAESLDLAVDTGATVPKRGEQQKKQDESARQEVEAGKPTDIGDAEPRAAEHINSPVGTSLLVTAGFLLAFGGALITDDFIVEFSVGQDYLLFFLMILFSVATATAGWGTIRNERWASPTALTVGSLGFLCCAFIILYPFASEDFRELFYAILVDGWRFWTFIHLRGTIFPYFFCGATALLLVCHRAIYVGQHSKNSWAYRVAYRAGARRAWRLSMPLYGAWLVGMFVWDGYRYAVDLGAYSGGSDDFNRVIASTLIWSVVLAVLVAFALLGGKRLSEARAPIRMAQSR